MSMNVSESAATIVCKEVFDETSHPSNEEVLDYAKRIGIKPDAEPHLLDLAREGLMAALPKGWTPVYNEAIDSFYYYQPSTGITTWEHPLDAVYREIVKQARAGNIRQTSIEEDSKTTAKDLDSHEEATLPKEVPKELEKISGKPNPILTRIPTKLAPLKRPERIEGQRRKSATFENPGIKRDTIPKSEAQNPLATDRASRDYTNLKFQDPKFYECPKLLDPSAVGSTAPSSLTVSANSKKELDLKQVLKRSESLSPRHEKDWEQLTSKFSSDGNIIDIDKLSASTLARSEKNDKFDKEKHPSHFGPPKELTLSGGGTVFLKSNRSRDATPSQEGGKLEEFRSITIAEEIGGAGDRLKSILREKQSEDDDKHVEEERKSVRFDLEREINIKFTYSMSEDDCESREYEKAARDEDHKGLGFDLEKETGRKVLESECEDDWESESEEQHQQPAHNAGSNVLSSERSSSQSFASIDKPTSKFRVKNIDSAVKKNTKIVGKRFLVQNVSENEHLNQVVKDSSSSKSSSSNFVPTKSKKSHAEIDLARQEQIFSVKTEYSKSLDETRAKLSKQHEKDVENLRKEYVMKLEQTKQQLEECFQQQQQLLQQSFREKLEKLKREMHEKEEQELQKLVAEMDVARLENLKKVKTELETCYEKEKQGILANLKTELDERRRELLELRNQEMGKLEAEHEREIGEEKLAKLSEIELTKQHAEKIDTLKKELDKEFDDLRSELRLHQREKVAKIREDHEKCLAEILKDFKIDEDLARKMYKQRLEEVRVEITRSAEKEARRQVDQARQQDNVDFEKMRCEKRLLQDKYTALKEKYIKLKNDVRLAVDRRSKRKEGYTTTSETESSPLRNAYSNSSTKPEEGQSVSERSQTHQHQHHQQQQQQPHQQQQQQQQRRQEPRSTGSTSCSLSQATKPDSDDTITATSESNLLTERDRRPPGPRRKNSGSGMLNSGCAAANHNTNNNTSNNNNNNNLENPVENIRKQLKKLEDLGDQLPSNETAYTLRYPFQDEAPANASSELEFFRHRLHVEKDSVRRAREALRHQRNVFQRRQRAWKQRSARAALEQLVQEERELSEMEVSLHRTRSLLCEKVIHLRHLKQSLEWVANVKKSESEAASTKNDELTLSDTSSASSGFSSTDIGTDTFMDKPDPHQESTEIIASLESLNSEIREIWDVLNKRQDTNMPPSPTFMYSYLRWLQSHHLATQSNNVQGTFGTPNIQSNILTQLTVAQPPTTTTQNIIAQYGPNSRFTTSVGTAERSSSNLTERIKSLRDWMRQARVESANLVTPGQATL